MPTLIDAGVGDAAHVHDVASALEGTALAQVLITHGHADHAGGLPALRERWPALSAFPASAEEPPQRDGSRLNAGDGQLAVLYTPGHSPDHLCFFDEEAGDIYCGDLVRMNGTIVIPAGRGGNLTQYLGSLRRIRDLRPRRLLPGHGPIITDATALIDGYIAHRANRERQILEALRRRSGTPHDLVSEVYGQLSDGLEDAAAESILAHLVKLEEEGRAALRRLETGGNIWHAL